MEYIGALEAGGTKMVCAIGSASGEIIEQVSFPTDTPQQCMPHIIDWFAARDICALGIGSFGPTGVDPSSETYGYILETPKKDWAGFNLLGTLQDALAIPCAYDTDVNVACLGEATFGCAQNISNVLYLTVGTGIGAGVLIEGNLIHGMLHPEAGHIRLKKHPDDPGTSICPWHDDCLEGLASGPSIEARWGKKAYELSDDKRVWEIESDYLAQALATFILTYSPQRIILGGGVMKQTQLFALIRQKTQDYLNGYIKTPELEDIEHYIVPNSLQEKQGIMGCIELGRRVYKQKL